MTNKNLFIIIAVLIFGVLVAITMDIPDGFIDEDGPRVVASNKEDMKG